MIVLVYPHGSLGRAEPVKLHANQVIVMQDNGTPIAVAGEYGPKGTQAVSRIGDTDFNATLNKLGLPAVHYDDVVLPAPPSGARLLAGPALPPRS